MSKSERKFSSTVSHDEAVVKMLRENPSYAQLYLQIALDEIYEDRGIPAYLIALRRVIEARGGIGEISAKAGLSRQQLYRTLSENGNPTLTTLMRNYPCCRCKTVRQHGQVALISARSFFCIAAITPALSAK